MNISDILSRSWSLYTRFFTRFVVIAGAFYLVLNLVGALLVEAAGDSGSGVILLAFANLALAVVGTYWVQGALVEATVDVEDGQADIPIAELFGRVAPVLGPLIGAGLLAGLGIGIGLLLFIVPGLYLMTRWALIVPAIVLEKTPAMQSFGRSSQLVTGNGWNMLGLLVIIFVIAVISGAIVSGVLGSIFPTFLGNWIGNTIANSLVTPFQAIAITLVYRDLSRTSPKPAA